MKVIFIHRSVGNNLIQDGGIYTLLKKYENISFSDFNQNTSKLRDATGIKKTDMKMPGGDTHPENYVELFSDTHTSKLQTFILEFDLIIIKSCYPNSNISSGEELEQIKDHYTSIARFCSSKNQKILIITSPPLRPRSTTPLNAKRARKLSDWLVSKNFGNSVHVFNLYDHLASSGDVLKREYRRYIWLDNHPNKKASQKIAPELVRDLVAFMQSGSQGHPENQQDQANTNK